MDYKDIPANEGNIRYNTDLSVLEIVVDGIWMALSHPEPGIYIFKHRMNNLELLILAQASFSVNGIELRVIGEKKKHDQPAYFQHESLNNITIPGKDSNDWLVNFEIRKVDIPWSKDD